ncbi:MAG: ATP-binding protein [bacterium]
MPFSNHQKQFFGRNKELQILENHYEQSKSQAQLLSLTGKIRLGKTQLLKEFFKNKPYIYYLASQSSWQDQLQSMVEIFTTEFDDTYLDKNALPSWRKFFEYLGSKLKIQKKPIIIVLDEFTKLIQSDPSVLSALEYAWENLIKTTRVMIILVGSSISDMDKYVFSTSSPIAKKRTGQISLNPFTFKEIYASNKDNDFEDIFKLYALVGGVPAYLKELDTKKSFKENILKKILAKNSFLSIEPNLLIADEFNDPKIYLSILKAIAAGSLKYSELLNITGLTATKLPIYLKNLVSLKFVKRELPVTIKHPEKSKKGNYSINDYFLRFYFTMVFPHLSLIEEGNFEILFKNYSTKLDQILETTYQQVAPEFIQDAIDKKLLPEFEKVGQWWDNQDQVSLVGLNESSSQILFCDTFWNNKHTTLHDLKTLQAKAKNVDWQNQSRTEHYALISKKGFTLELIHYAKQHSIVLIEGNRVV